MLNESAPAWLRIACLTEALSPWISDTTAMIDVTATMLPRTVMNDRSLAPQIALSAIAAESRNLFMRVWAGPALPGLLRVVDLDLIAVGHPAHRVVRAGDDLIAFPRARHHLEILVAGDAHLDRHELGLVRADHEHAFGFLAGLPRLQFGRRRDRLRRSPPLVGLRLLDHLAVRVIHELAHRDRRNRHR